MNIYKNSSLKIQSNSQIISILSANEKVTSEISGFQQALQKLKAIHKKTEENFAKLGKVPVSREDAKNDSRNILIEKILPVVTILGIFAYDSKKRKLLKQLKDLKSEKIINCSDNKLIKASKKIWVLASKHGGYSFGLINKTKSSIKEYKSKTTLFKEKYGLQPEMIKNIEDANIQFIESVLLFEDDIRQQKKMLRKIKKSERQTEKLLENKIDPFVILFENKNPDLFKDYFDERLKHLPAKASKKMAVNQKPETKEVPVAKKKIKKAIPKKQSKSTQEETSN